MIDTQTDNQPKVMTVRAREDGHWYVGSGRSIANGPYRRPDQLIEVVSDLMGDNTNWRIEVLNGHDTLIAAYDGRDVKLIGHTKSRNQIDWPQIGTKPNT
jgi:hypothetical protein